MKLPEIPESIIKAIIEYIGHVVLTIIALVGFRIVKAVVFFLSPNDDVIVFGITMSLVFKLFDLVLIVGIMGVGTWKVLNAYRR